MVPHPPEDSPTQKSSANKGVGSRRTKRATVTESISPPHNFVSARNFDAGSRLEGETGSMRTEPNGDRRSLFQCDLQAMRNDRGFLNDFFLNADSFDGFYNKGVQRELEQLERIHELVDKFLAIKHEGQTS